MLGTIVLLVLALGLLATCILAAERFLKIPAPFDWIKGLIIFTVIVLGCYAIWEHFAPRLANLHF